MAEPTDAPCVPITVHTYGLTDEAWNAAFDRVGKAAHAKDELLFTASAGTCPHCEDKPEPTWRDVIREFLKLGPYLLERRTTDGNRYWRYETNQRTKGGLRELVDILHFPTESTWIVKLGLYGPHQVTLRNPTPAQVLAAVRLVGLGGSDGGAS